MIRHILFWNYTDKVKQEHKEDEMLKFMQKSVDTMNGNINRLIHAEIGRNIAGGYDLCSMRSLTMSSHSKLL